MAEAFKTWKKSQTMIFLNASKTAAVDYVRLGKTDVFDMALNPETETFSFIDQDVPTEFLSNYKPQLPVEYLLAEGDPGFDAIWDMFEALQVGSGAVRSALIVFPKAGTTAGTFRAWRADATVVFQNYTTVDKKLKLELYFGGTFERGEVVIEDGAPVFTADAA